VSGAAAWFFAPVLLTAFPLSAEDLSLTAGKSLVLDSRAAVERIAVANGEIAEAIAVSPRELLINGKSPGQTSLVVWQRGEQRVSYDLTVQPNSSRLNAVRRELSGELPGQPVTLAVDGDTVFLKGSVHDLASATRAATIAGALGRIVNLLRVDVPPAKQQILLKVRFANVDRSASRELGANLASLASGKTTGSATTGTFSPPKVKEDGSLTVSDALNIFLFRRDLNLAATIRALQSRNLLEMLAEPNVMAIDGRPASFVSGGEFPFPTLQGGGSGLGAVTIAFREFGVRIQFLPRMTPRGIIRLQVMPEVSSLDFANGLTFQGFHIPALATRRVQTEVELEAGQSFLIAGLLDNRLTETVARVPGLAQIPLLGKLFQSQSSARNRTELLVLVTPQLARPLAPGQTVPALDFPEPLAGRDRAPEQPGRTAAPSRRRSVPVEELLETPREQQPAPAPALQIVPVQTAAQGS
jgi:pilus assembly protein CpaC